MTYRFKLPAVLIISTAESIQLCFTNCHVVHIHFVCIVHVVLVAVNNLIRAHYDIIMKTAVASGGKSQVTKLVTRCSPLCDGFDVVILMNLPPWSNSLGDTSFFYI